MVNLMRRLIVVLLINTCFFFYGCTIAETKEIQMQVKKEKLIEIGNNKAQELGYNLKEMQINADENNAHWYQYISSGPLLENNPILKKQLENKEFQVIYYSPKNLQKGGDLWVFIDKNTGLIITILEGK